MVGALLIDTGATKTSIGLATATALGLKPTRVAKGYGAGGEHHNPVYLARLEIGVQENQRVTVYGWEQEVLGIPDLEKHAQHLGLKEGGVSFDIVGLLGRDILRHTEFQYFGVNGRFRIKFDIQSLQQASPTR